NLGLTDRAELLVTSAFLWGKRDLPSADWRFRIADLNSVIRNPQSEIPWLVFCSPPYAFYHERQAEMLELIAAILEQMPSESIMVVEADEAFDFNTLPGHVAENRRDE